MLQREYHVPVLAPNNITIFNSKAVEFSGVKILVILRMRMAANKVTNIYRLFSIIIELQTNGQVPYILSMSYIQFLHNYIFFFINPKYSNIFGM